MKNHIKSPDTVRELNRNINVALVAVLIEDLDYPVKVVPLHLLQGPPICDNITYDSGVYRKVEPEENEKDFNNRFEQWKQSYYEWFQECTQNLTIEVVATTFHGVMGNHGIPRNIQRGKSCLLLIDKAKTK